MLWWLHVDWGGYDELVVRKAEEKHNMQRESYAWIVCKKRDFINCSSY